VAPVGSGHPATILVLEENAAVQELIDQALRESGHRVLTTNNALEALELLQRIRVDIVVVGDLLDERGQTLLGELHSVQAGLRIVSVSGPDADDRPRGNRSEREVVQPVLAGRPP
jgi:DNA-binding response OmpR family regulator